jgi:hypothetical protein
MEEVVRSFTPNNRFMRVIARGESVRNKVRIGQPGMEFPTPVHTRIQTVHRGGDSAARGTRPARSKAWSAPSGCATSLGEGDRPTFTHTSGIPNFTSFPDYQSTMSLPVTTERLVARFRDTPLSSSQARR